jgi:zinc protease
MNRKSWINKVGLATLVWAVLAFILLGSGCKEITIYPQGAEEAKSAKERLHFDYEEIELENGLRVITLEDFSCPIVAVQVWYHVGSKNENPARQGFAHMFEHMMFKGTDRVGPSDHFDFIQRVGGSNNGYTSFDTTVYLQTLPANQLELALWLEAERMNFLKINQDSFDTERNVVEEELRMGENRPYGTLSKKTFAKLFKVHPYQWTPIGKLQHLRVTSVGELRDFWTRYYVPNNATLLIVGAIKHAEAQAFARRYFGWIPKCSKPNRVKAREPKRTTGEELIIDDENAPAGMVQVIWRTVPAGHRDEVVLDLLSEILGGGNSSRLYRELVAEKQLAVSASASTYNLEHDGLFFADAVQAPDAELSRIRELIYKHIEKVKAEGVTEQELTKARNQILKRVVTTNLTIGSKARMLGSSAVVLGDTSRVNTMLDEIRAVKREDLHRAANEYLTNARALTVIVKQNMKGAMAGAKDDETVPITAECEEKAPAPGRKGVFRPEDFPAEAPFAELKAFKPRLEYSETTLDNGLKVMMVPNHEVPFVSVTLGLLNGAWTENKPGTASMAMQMLTKGTTRHTEAELAEELERYAISLVGAAGMDTSEVRASFLGEHIGRALELLAEVVVEPTFDEAEFEKLRKQVITTLAVEAATPRYLADKEFRKRLYGKHPYARTVEGEPADVEALQVGDLKQWWSRFVRPDKAALIFAGDIDEAKAVVLAEKMLGRWKVALRQPDIILADSGSAVGTHIYIVDQPGSMQSEIRIGQLGITRHEQPEYFISRVVGYYFGGSFNSRLNDTIRVKKGLTYGARGSYIAQNRGGEFRVSTFTKTDATAKTVEVALDEIRRLQEEVPTEKELGGSKSYFAGSFVRTRETPQQVARDLWLIESQKLGADYLERLLAKIARTTEEDCDNLVDDTLNPDKMIIVVVGDAAKIKDQLEKIAPVTVVPTQQD